MKNIDEIIEKYTPTVYRIAMSNSVCRADADDVYQQVFLAYFRTPPNTTDENYIKAWLIRTTLNYCKKTANKNKRNLPLDAANELITEFSAHEENELHTAILTLPEKYRIPICMYYFEELSCAEIAEILKEKEGTVRIHLKRGREKLKALLEKGELYE